MTLKYIFGLSGTHGTGKSTILTGLSDLGYSVDRSQLSRTAQKQLGWETLSIAGESVENMWALQDAILAALSERDQRIRASHKITVVERTPADLWAYTKMWCERLGIDYKEDITAKRYHTKCRLASRLYHMNFVVRPDEAIPFVAEPNRADEKSRLFVDEQILSYLLAPFIVTDLQHYVIKNTDREKRVNEIKAFIDVLELIRAPASFKGINLP